MVTGCRLPNGRAAWTRIALTGTVLATAVLGERLSPAGIAGAIILAATVLLTVRAHAQPPEPGA
jgi:drug/metabolite transporter (DMT)-like permease